MKTQGEIQVPELEFEMPGTRWPGERTRGDWAEDAAARYLTELREFVDEPEPWETRPVLYHKGDTLEPSDLALDVVRVSGHTFRKLEREAAAARSLMRACRKLLMLAQNRDMARLRVLDVIDLKREAEL